MEIRHVSLRNIRSYEHAELELPPGTTLIAGDVGAGKTSLLYAVEMALFGFAAVDAPFLIRHGAVHAEVTVTLEGGGHRYEVGRRFRRVNRKGRDSFEIERLTFAQDGARTVYSATELRQRVIDLFGFPDNPNPRSHSDLWRWAVYVPQERMREVLSQEPQERLETVRRALGVERYRLAADNAQEAASEIRQLARFRREESDQLTHWEAELVEREADLEQLEVRSVALADDVQRAEVALDGQGRSVQAAESALRSAEGDRREQEGLEREQARDRDLEASLASARAALEAEWARTPPVEEAQGAEVDRQLQELDRRAGDLRVERDNLRSARGATEARARELIQAQGELATHTNALTERTRRRDVVLEECRQAETELEQAEADGPTKAPPEPTPRTGPEIEAALAQARSEEREANEHEVRARAELEEIDRLLSAGECPRCHQAVRPSEFRAHRAEAEHALALCVARRAALSDQVTSIEGERRSRERFERARERFQEAERRRASARDRLAALRARAQEAEESVQGSARAVHQAQARVRALSPVIEQEARERAELSRVETEAGSVELEVGALRQRKELLQQASARREQQAAEHRRIVADGGTVGARLTDRAARLAALRERTLQLPTLDARLRELRERELELRRSLEALRVDRARVEQEATHTRRRRKEAREGVEERSRLLKETRELEAKATWLATPFREALLAMEQRILAQAQATFQRDFARFFRALIEDPMLEARVGAGFDPTVLIDGEWTPAEALSGGERTALALAFRLALGRVVRTMGALRLETLILDEPTDGFSPEQVVRMGELLRSLALPQLILVSHEGQLSAVAGRVVQAVKDGGRSELRTVGQPVAAVPAREDPIEPPARTPRHRSAAPSRADPH